MSLDRFERTMLASAHRDAPDPARKAAARRMMLEAAGVGAVTAAAATSTKATIASATTAKTAGALAVTKILKLVVIATVIAGGGAATVVVASRPTSTPNAAPASTARGSTTTPIGAATSEAPRDTERVFVPSDLPSAVDPTPARAPSTTTASAQAPTDDPLALETKLLARAQGALSRGDRASAAAALGEYEARFRGGALADEAQLLAIDLALANGDRAEARRRAAALLAKDPQSPYRSRLSKLTEETP